MANNDITALYRPINQFSLIQSSALTDWKKIVRDIQVVNEKYKNK